MLKVTFSNGEEIICTKYHKFYIINTDKKKKYNSDIFDRT
jgi:intein/homing endonuclease